MEKKIHGNKVITALSDSGKKAEQIREMTKTLADLVTEINLLAINLSIESAKVGECGHDLSVMANQIFALSNSALGIAKNTSKIAEKIILQNDQLLEEIEKDV